MTNVEAKSFWLNLGIVRLFISVSHNPIYRSMLLLFLLCHIALSLTKKPFPAASHLDGTWFNYLFSPQVDEFNCKRIIKPQEGREIWSSVVVKMPHSPSNVMTARTGISQVCVELLHWMEKNAEFHKVPSCTM